MKVADRIQVFIDLDGVLADFLSAACVRLGRKLDELPTGTYDLSRLFEMSWADIDAKIGRDYEFWRHMPAYLWAKDVVALLRKAQTDGIVSDIFVLSSPWQQSPECHKAKLEWCDVVLGIPTSDVILTPHKELLAAPNRLLIDDLRSHCEDWSERGGYAIMFPCYHNTDQMWTFSSDPFIHFSVALACTIVTHNYFKNQKYHVPLN